MKHILMIYCFDYLNKNFLDMFLLCIIIVISPPISCKILLTILLPFCV